MDVNLHQQQGINLINRVLEYARYVIEDDRAHVHLTPEDWYVVADTLFQRGIPKEVLPEEIHTYRMINNSRTIEFQVDEYAIEVHMID